MLFVVFVSAVLALSAPAVQGQFYGWGRCPKVDVAQHFRMSEWLGTWIEIARFPNYFERNVHCLTETNTILEDGRVTWASNGIRDGLGVEVDPYISLVNPEEPATFYGPYYGVNYLPLWILEIDHDPQTGYYVLYSCYDIWVGNMQFLWIMSKERQIDKGRLNGILGRLEGYGIDTSKLEYVRQDITCPALRRH